MLNTCRWILGIDRWGRLPIGLLTASITIDRVGLFTGTATISSFAASPEFESLIEQKIERYPGVIKLELWPTSDHHLFYSHGATSLALTSEGHMSSDSSDWISGEKPGEAMQRVLDLFEKSGAKDVSWGRQKNSS